MLAQVGDVDLNGPVAMVEEASRVVPRMLELLTVFSGDKRAAAKLNDITFNYAFNVRGTSYWSNGEVIVGGEIRGTEHRTNKAGESRAFALLAAMKSPSARHESAVFCVCGIPGAAPVRVGEQGEIDATANDAHCLVRLPVLR